MRKLRPEGSVPYVRTSPRKGKNLNSLPLSLGPLVKFYGWVWNSFWFFNIFLVPNTLKPATFRGWSMAPANSNAPSSLWHLLTPRQPSGGTCSFRSWRMQLSNCLLTRRKHISRVINLVQPSLSTWPLFFFFFLHHYKWMLMCMADLINNSNKKDSILAIYISTWINELKNQRRPGTSTEMKPHCSWGYRDWVSTGLPFSVCIIRTGEERKGKVTLNEAPYLLFYVSCIIWSSQRPDKNQVRQGSLKTGIAGTDQHPARATTIRLLPELSVVGLCGGKSTAPGAGETEPAAAFHPLWQYATWSSRTPRWKELLDGKLSNLVLCRPMAVGRAPGSLCSVGGREQTGFSTLPSPSGKWTPTSSLLQSKGMSTRSYLGERKESTASKSWKKTRYYPRLLLL